MTKLHVAHPQGMQRATNRTEDATEDATTVQRHPTTELKALAEAVLNRNSRRNTAATGTHNACNTPTPKTLSKLHAQLQAEARKSIAFCLRHESTLPGSTCTRKQQLSGCLLWELKNAGIDYTGYFDQDQSHSHPFARGNHESATGTCNPAGGSGIKP